MAKPHSTTLALNPIRKRNFFTKISKTENCWIWIAGKYTNGYGCFRVGEHSYPAHRVSYEIHYGAIPPGKWVLHKCDNPACVRPDHLYLGDVQDNANDMVSRGRAATGTKNGKTKLDPINVKAIRALAKETSDLRVLAFMFDVSVGHIKNIADGKYWKEIA